MSERLVFSHNHEVKKWPNELGLSWNINVLPDGNFTRITWPHDEQESGSGPFCVLRLDDSKWPIRRDATIEEIYNFALLAMEQMPDEELVMKMASDAARVVGSAENSALRKRKDIEKAQWKLLNSG
jgi:hypothetical protein